MSHVHIEHRENDLVTNVGIMLEYVVCTVLIFSCCTKFPHYSTCMPRKLHVANCVSLNEQCRKKSDFVVPSVVFVTGDDKQAVIQKFKMNISQIPCKYYYSVENTPCPFGGSCFYMHGEEGKTTKRKQSWRTNENTSDCAGENSCRNTSQSDLENVGQLMLAALEQLVNNGARCPEALTERYSQGASSTYTSLTARRNPAGIRRSSSYHRQYSTTYRNDTPQVADAHFECEEWRFQANRTMR